MKNLETSLAILSIITFIAFQLYTKHEFAYYNKKAHSIAEYSIGDKLPPLSRTENEEWHRQMNLSPLEIPNLTNLRNYIQTNSVK